MAHGTDDSSRDAPLSTTPPPVDLSLYPCVGSGPIASPPPLPPPLPVLPPAVDPSLYRGYAAYYPPPPRLRRPWGFWATMGLGAACICLLFLVQTVVVIAAAAIACLTMGANFSAATLQRDFYGNGLMLSLAILGSSSVCLALVVLFIRLRDWRVREYLALRRLRLGSIALGIVLIGVVVGAMTFVNFRLQAHRAAHVQVRGPIADACSSASTTVLVVLALVVAAPVFEESLFRGFLFRGIAESSAGPVVAILLTAVLFGLIHLQYGLVMRGELVVVGLLLGVVRYKARSTTLTMLLHALINLAAIVEVMVQMSMR